MATIMTGAGVRPDAFSYEGPSGERVLDETRVFSNANAYEWSYLDTCRENGVDPKRVPDGWPFAYLEYTRRATTHQMAIREAFRMWRDTGTLPGLD